MMTFGGNFSKIPAPNNTKVELTLQRETLLNWNIRKNEEVAPRSKSERSVPQDTPLKYTQLHGTKSEEE